MRYCSAVSGLLITCDGVRNHTPAVTRMRPGVAGSVVAVEARAWIRMRDTMECYTAGLDVESRYGQAWA